MFFVHYIENILNLINSDSSTNVALNDALYMKSKLNENEDLAIALDLSKNLESAVPTYWSNE